MAEGPLAKPHREESLNNINTKRSGREETRQARIQRAFPFQHRILVPLLARSLAGSTWFVPLLSISSR
jgi:hypothetical protein